LAPRITAARLKARRDKPKGGRVGRRGGRYKLPPIHNGRISTSVRLACVLRYFAGGSPYDFMVKYGISHTNVKDSVWYVVHAVNTASEFKIEYPSCEVEQTRIAAGFERVSEVGFSNCAGAINGVLIWMQKPMLKEARRVGVDQAKFLCGRKSKFGLNCQAVSDVNGKILDLSIAYGGSAADCVAFEASDLYACLSNGLLKKGVFFLETMHISICCSW
jgi:hypothetical protein